MLNTICKVMSVNDENAYIMIHSATNDPAVIRIQVGDDGKMHEVLGDDVIDAIAKCSRVAYLRKNKAPVTVTCEIMNPDNDDELEIKARPSVEFPRAIMLDFLSGEPIYVRCSDLRNAVSMCSRSALRRMPYVGRGYRPDREYEEE